MQIKMPSLSPTMTDGSIVNWNKKEGEEVCAGDVLCEVQTDKAVVALEAEEDGVLAKIHVPENTPNIAIGQLIAVMANPDEDWKEVAASAQSPAAPATKEAPSSPPQAATIPSAPAQTATTSTPTTGAGAPTSRPDLIGPAVRVLLEKHNLDVSKIPATGPRGILQKSDVLSFIASPVEASATVPSSSAPSPTKPSSTKPAPVGQPSAFVDLPLSPAQIQRASQIVTGKQSIPHTYVHARVCTDKVDRLIEKLTDKKFSVFKLSRAEFLVKACALALRLVPELNACSGPDGTSLQQKSTVDINFTVATPEGTLYPTIYNVDQLPLSVLAKTTSQITERASLSSTGLQPHELQAGSFTICDLTSSGIREMAPNVNHPNVGTLAIGCCPPQPKLTSTNSIEFASFASLVLSIDSRFVDEVAAGRFLGHVKRLIGEHVEMLLADDPLVKTSGALGDTKGPDADDFDVMMLSPSLDASTQSQTV